MENKQQETISHIIQCNNCTTKNKVCIKRQNDDITFSNIFCKKCGKKVFLYVPDEFKEDKRRLIRHEISKRSFWFNLIYTLITTTFSLTFLITCARLITEINSQNPVHALLFVFFLFVIAFQLLSIVTPRSVSYVAEED